MTIPQSVQHRQLFFWCQKRLFLQLRLSRVVELLLDTTEYLKNCIQKARCLHSLRGTQELRLTDRTAYPYSPYSSRAVVLTPQTHLNHLSGNSRRSHLCCLNGHFFLFLALLAQLNLNKQNVRWYSSPEHSSFQIRNIANLLFYSAQKSCLSFSIRTSPQARSVTCAASLRSTM